MTGNVAVMWYYDTNANTNRNIRVMWRINQYIKQWPMTNDNAVI